MSAELQAFKDFFLSEIENGNNYLDGHASAAFVKVVEQKLGELEALVPALASRFFESLQSSIRAFLPGEETVAVMERLLTDIKISLNGVITVTLFMEHDPSALQALVVQAEARLAAEQSALESAVHAKIAQLEAQVAEQSAMETDLAQLETQVVEQNAMETRIAQLEAQVAKQSAMETKLAQLEAQLAKSVDAPLGAQSESVDAPPLGAQSESVDAALGAQSESIGIPPGTQSQSIDAPPGAQSQSVDAALGTQSQSVSLMASLPRRDPMRRAYDRAVRVGGRSTVWGMEGSSNRIASSERGGSSEDGGSRVRTSSSDRSAADITVDIARDNLERAVVRKREAEERPQRQADAKRQKLAQAAQQKLDLVKKQLKDCEALYAVTEALPDSDIKTKQLGSLNVQISTFKSKIKLCESNLAQHQ